MKMAGNNILTRKQLENMTREQLIDFAMKLPDNLISKQTELINGNKELWEKHNVIEAKFDDLKKENETLHSKVIIAEKTSTALSLNYNKLNDKIIEMERNMDNCEWMHQNRRHSKQYHKWPSRRTRRSDFRKVKSSNWANGHNSFSQIKEEPVGLLLNYLTGKTLKIS